MRKILAIAVVMLFAVLAFGQSPGPNVSATQCVGLTSGQTCTLSNLSGAGSLTFEYSLQGGPIGVQIVVQGCMTNGTCDVLDTYTGTTNINKHIDLSNGGPYPRYVVTPTLTGGTNPTVNIGVYGTIAKSSGGSNAKGTQYQIQVSDGGSPAKLTNSPIVADNLGDLGVPGNAQFALPPKIGTGLPSDNTITTAGMPAKWDSTNHRLTANLSTDSNTAPWLTSYVVANTSDGTGQRADGMNACGGGGVVAGAVFCVYAVGMNTTTAAFDASGATEGDLYGASLVTNIKYADLGTGLLNAVTAGRRIFGVITGGCTPGPCTAQVTTWLGYQTSAAVTQAHSVIFDIDGNGATITSGEIGKYGTTQATGVIYRVDALGHGATTATACNISVDVEKVSAGSSLPNVGSNKISASAPGALSAQTVNQNQTPTGWSTSVAAGDIWSANVQAGVTCYSATIQVWYQ